MSIQLSLVPLSSTSEPLGQWVGGLLDPKAEYPPKEGLNDLAPKALMAQKLRQLKKSDV